MKESADKIKADAHKAYIRQGPTNLPTVNQVQAKKIKEQEILLWSADNHGQGTNLTFNNYTFGVDWILLLIYLFLGV